MLGFFSYFYDALDRPCSAAYGNNAPTASTVNIDATQAINVQSRFRMAIRFGFYLSVLNFGRVAINQVSIWYKNQFLYWIALVMYGIIFMLILVWFVFAQIWRWSYSGRVCSGDFLSADEKSQLRHSGNNDTYLIAEGNFLLGVIIAIYSMVGLLLLVVFAVALFCSQKKTQEELAARKGGLFKTDMAPAYEAKIQKPSARR